VTKKAHIFLVFGSLLLGACTMFQAPTPDPPTPVPATATLAIPTPVVPTPLPDLPGISPEQVRNSEYQLGFYDQIRMVQLTDGQYQEGTPAGTDYISVSVTDFIARGDLNGDGENEAVAIVAENYGGTGTSSFGLITNSSDRGNLGTGPGKGFGFEYKFWSDCYLTAAHT